MRTILTAFLFLWITTGILCAQNSDEKWTLEDSVFVFEEVQGKTVYVHKAQTRYVEFDKSLTGSLSNSRFSKTVLLRSYDELEPLVPWVVVHVKESPLIKALCIRVPGLNTQVMGYCNVNSCFIINVAEDSVADTDIFDRITEYVKEYTKYAQTPQIQKMKEQSLWIASDVHTVLNDKGIAKAILESTVKRINRYATAECIAFHPGSKAALFRYSAANFIPQWKWTLVDLFLAQETNGKYGIDNLTDMNEATSNKLRADFLKKLDNLTQ